MPAATLMAIAARRRDSPSRTGLQHGTRERPSHRLISKEALMPYNNIITRSDADATIPIDVVDDLISAATGESAALTLFRRAQLSTKTSKLPVLAALPVAYWVNGDTGLKQTSEAAWQGVDLIAEEVATIIPIPEAVLDDSDFDIWTELRPALAEAIAVTLDAAVFGGINKPASWPEAVVPAAI